MVCCATMAQLVAMRVASPRAAHTPCRRAPRRCDLTRQVSNRRTHRAHGEAHHRIGNATSSPWTPSIHVPCPSRGLRPRAAELAQAVCAATASRIGLVSRWCDDFKRARRAGLCTVVRHHAREHAAHSPFGGVPPRSPRKHCLGRHIRARDHNSCRGKFLNFSLGLRASLWHINHRTLQRLIQGLVAANRRFFVVNLPHMSEPADSGGQ